MSSPLPVPITRHPNMLTSQLIIYGVVWVLHAGMACNFGLALGVVDTPVAIRNAVGSDRHAPCSVIEI